MRGTLLLLLNQQRNKAVEHIESVHGALVAPEDALSLPEKVGLPVFPTYRG
jgi:hypothetical protein